MQQERHKWLCDVMNVMHSNRCIVSIWNARYRHQPRWFRKIYFIVWTIYKLWKTNEHTILKLWTLIKNIIERLHKFPYNILFTFLMDRGRAPNGIGHLIILPCSVYWHSCSVVSLWMMQLLATISFIYNVSCKTYFHVEYVDWINAKWCNAGKHLVMWKTLMYFIPLHQNLVVSSLKYSCKASFE